MFEKFKAMDPIKRTVLVFFVVAVVAGVAATVMSGGHVR